MQTFRQGDILLRRVEKLPTTRTRKTDGVIAYGEVTGHAHRVVDGGLWESGGGLFVESDGGAVVKHEEHGVGAGPDNDIWDGALPRGIYQVVRQKEYTGPTTSVRTVRD